MSGEGEDKRTEAKR